jgi:D-amino peptidase
MRVYMMTDLEGVAGVLNFQEWTGPGKPYYEMAREFLTLEVNAAVDGLLEGGATEILVMDAHGPGAINVKLLDPRVEVQRGWSDPVWPLCLDKSFDFVVWVGQHAKACTEYGHLCHTQSLAYIDESVNGISIGEFGELAMCASELGVRAIFGSGDAAFAKEAQTLVPGIEAVAVKWGVKPGSGEDLDEEAYGRHTASARHLHPVRARRLIREGALRAIQRARREEFGIIPLKAPFARVIKLRPNQERPKKTIARMSHPTSFIGVMNTWGEFKPLEESADGG